MSYDLVVFEPREELRERSAFLAWYDARTEWTMGFDYFNPANASPALHAWYREMIETFPPLNGPERPVDLEQCCADYSIGCDFIYVGFTGAKTRIAYDEVVRLAAKHGVGFFNASGDSAVWFPTNGGLELAHEHEVSDRPGRIARLMTDAISRDGAVYVETLEEALAQMTAVADPQSMKPVVITGKAREKGDGSP